MQHPQTSPQDAQLESVLADYLERVDRGEQVDVDAMVASHPRLAHDLRGFFDDAALIADLAGPTIAEQSRIAATGDTVSRISTRDTQPVLDAAGKRTRSVAAPELPERFGRYRILRLLGRGGMGSVYLAEDSELHRQVALKVPLLDEANEPELVERFYREARSSARLQHRNICPVFDVGQVGGVRYLTMAYIQGRSLAECRGESPLIAARLIQTLAMALEEAHAHGVIHRDLKPSNVMIDEKGEPVVMDFGLARLVAQTPESGITQHGMIIGSPAYMSPEQVRGESSEIGPGTDVYGLGVVFYELLTGHVPFQGTMGAVIGKILSEPPRPPSQLRPELDLRLERVCLKMLAKPLAERYGSMIEVVTALQEIFVQPAREESLSSHNLQTKPARMQNARPLWATAAGLFVFLVLCGVLIYVKLGEATVAIEIDDPSLALRFAGNTLTIKDAGRIVRVWPGDHKLVVEQNGLSVTTEEITLRRGATRQLRITLIDGQVLVLKDRDSPPAIAVKSPPPARDVPTAPAVTVKPAEPSNANQVAAQKAADWVREQGGQVTLQVKETSQVVPPNGTLPAAEFSLAMIRLQHWKGSREPLVPVPGFAGPEQAFFDGSEITDQHMRELSGWTNLRNLVLPSTQVTDQGLQYLKNLPNLTRLDIGGIQVGDTGIAEIAKHPGITALLVQNLTISDEGMGHLGKMPSLREIWLNQTPVSAEGMKRLCANRKLTHLRLWKSGLTGSALAHLRNLPELTFAEIAQNNLNDDDLAHLEGLAVVELWLNRNRFKGRGLKVLSTLPRLQILQISDMGIDDDGLAQLPPLPKLRSLELGRAKITDASVESLKQFTGLKVLNIKRTGITLKGLEQIRKALPECQVAVD